MDVKSLIDKVLKYDNDGEIIIELIEQKIISIKDVVMFGVNSNNLELIFLLSKYANEEDIQLLEDKVIEIGEPEYICGFACNVKGANIEHLENKIIEIGNPRYIFEFACNVKEANIELLEDKIIEIGNCHYMLLFAKHKQDANIEKLANKVLELQDPHYIYLFALIIPKINIEKFGNTLAITNDEYYVSRFLIRLGNKISKECRDKLMNVLIKNENVSLIEELFLNTNYISLFEYKEALNIIKKGKNKKLVKKIMSKFNY